MTEDGYDCGTMFPSVCVTVCGDGFIRGIEVCDDNNILSNDGCLSDCSGFEDGFNCVPAS